MQAWGGPVATPGLHSASSAGWVPRGRGGPPHQKRNRLSEIDLRTGLHAAAATISLEKTLTVCSMYVPPNSPISKLSLAELFEQLPKPFLVLGDFNAQSPAWGDFHGVGRGRILEDLIILNSGEQTFCAFGLSFDLSD
ncbi:hypothetical protein PoB_001426700 [Plakobranchus ocellatus]|uniref:Endonuclease/exonuclease/phosphatase domain-containing protein n=1 Tax=Plakobranchus ocellatus TaxID=259542 RepID=A0AAV3YZN6_9GAST|nr:hypothetical protein PoB_001426700 [Plakobranchus ocellatus]